MTERLGPPPRGSRYPVWAWKAWRGEESPKPDLRARAHLPPGTRGARIEIDAPAERVLLSDFMRWHCVLAGQYLADDEREDDAVAAMPWSRARAEESWSRIFELGRGDPDYHGPVAERSVQATLWFVTLDDVRRLTWFTAR